MSIYDLSPEISEKMTVYKNKAGNLPKMKVIRTIKEVANESRIDIYLHTGSHVDAPYHFLEKGKTIEKASLDKFMGKAIVLDFTKIKDSINKKILLKKNFFADDIVLLKTRNKTLKKFDFKFTYLEKSGAEYLVSKKIKAVGIDSLSVERGQHDYGTHKILLRNNIPIFEGLNLSKVRQGRYIFYGFPLKIRKGEASPVRAVLIG